MPSFTLYDLDTAFWQRVQAKAAREQTTVKALILRLLRQWLGVVVLSVLSIACEYHAPDAPTPIAPMATTAPASLNLGSVAGSGSSAGATTLTATVQNGGGVALPGVLVAFTTDVGTLSAASVMTTAGGQAASILTSAGGSTSAVTVTAGTLSTRLLVTTPATVPVPPTPPPPVLLPDPTPLPPPLTVTLIVTTRQSGAADFALATTTIRSATWTFGDSSVPVTTTEPFTSHTYTSSGTYPASVTVTDTLGRVASATATVTATLPPPPTTTPTGLVVTLTCIPATHLSSTPTACNVSVTYGGALVLPSAFSLVAWDFGDGHTSYSLLGSNTYSQAGTYTVVVTVGANTVDGSKTAWTSKSLIVP